MTQFTIRKVAMAISVKVGVVGLIAAVFAGTVLSQVAFAYSPYDHSAEAIAKTVREVIDENGGNIKVKTEQINNGTLTAEQTRFSDDWRRYMSESYAETPFAIANKDVWAKISPDVKFTFYKEEAYPNAMGFVRGNTIALSTSALNVFDKSSLRVVAHEYAHTSTVRVNHGALREGMAEQISYTYTGLSAANNWSLGNGRRFVALPHYLYDFYKVEWLRTKVFRSDDTYYKLIAAVSGEHREKDFEAYLDYYFESMGMPISADGFFAADARVFDSVKANPQFKTELEILSGIDSTKKLTAEQVSQLTAFYTSVLGADYQTQYPKKSAYTAFTAGSVVSGVTAKRVSDTINVSWDTVVSARYAVYYAYKDNVTGVPSNWNVMGAGSSSLSIDNLVKGVTYYITVLPYTDAPSRSYGGFSPYVQVVT